MTTSTMPSATNVIQGLELIATGYRWLAITQHLILLLLAFLYWVYRDRVSWTLPLYFFFTSVVVATLAVLETHNLAMETSNLVTVAVFGILAVLFLAEAVSPETDYSTKRMKKHNLIIALITVVYAWWYPMSGDYVYSLISSPYGILPAPTLLVFMALYLTAIPKTNKNLHFFMTISSFYYGIMGVMRLKMYWDLPLAVIAFYTLVMLNLTRDKYNR